MIEPQEVVLGQTGFSIARHLKFPGSEFVTLKTQRAAAVLFTEGDFVWLLEQEGREGVSGSVFKTVGGFCRVTDPKVFHEVSAETLEETALRHSRAKMGFDFDIGHLEPFGGTLGYVPIVNIPITFFNCRSWRQVGAPTASGCTPIRLHIEAALDLIDQGKVYDDATVLHLQRHAIEWLRRTR